MVEEFSTRSLQLDAMGLSTMISTFLVLCSGIDRIFPFSENGPANHNFHRCQSYQQITQKIKKYSKKQSMFFRKSEQFTHQYILLCGIFTHVFDIFLIFLSNLLVTLKTMNNYNLRANVQKMEKSDL